MKISKREWKEVSKFLKEHNISYTLHCEERSQHNRTVTDRYIQVNFVIEDYYEDLKYDFKYNETLIDGCKKYLGKAPYDNWNNICAKDAFFYMDLCNVYGEQNVEAVIKMLENT